MKFQVKPCRQPAGSPPSARSLERQPSKSNQATTARFFVNQENALTLSVLLGPKGRPCRGLPSPAAPPFPASLTVCVPQHNQGQLDTSPPQKPKTAPPPHQTLGSCPGKVKKSKKEDTPVSCPRSPSSPWPQTSRGLHILTCKTRAGISAAVRLPPGLQRQSCPASQTKWHLSCSHFHGTFSPFCFLPGAQHTQVFRTSSSFLTLHAPAHCSSCSDS